MPHIQAHCGISIQKDLQDSRTCKILLDFGFFHMYILSIGPRSPRQTLFIGLCPIVDQCQGGTNMSRNWLNTLPLTFLAAVETRLLVQDQILVRA